MASGGGSDGASRSGGPGGGGRDPSRRGPRRSRASVAVDVEDLALTFAGHEEFQRTAARYLEVSMREHELLSRANARLEGEVATLRQQVAVLTAELNLRRGESAAPPGEDDKPQ